MNTIKIKKCLLCGWVLMLMGCEAEPGVKPVLVNSQGVSTQGSTQAADEETSRQILNNDQVRLEQKLAKGLDLNVPLQQKAQNEYITPLGLAAQSGVLNMVAWLLNHGAQVNRADAQGRTPLYLTQNLKVAELLLEKGADPNQRDSSGVPLLNLAINSQNFAMVELLLKKGARPRDYDPSLFFQSQDIGILYLLIEAGADPTASNSQGQSLLEMSEDIDFVAFLLDRGVQASGPQGTAALHSTGSLEKFNLLLQKGASLTALSKAGQSLLADQTRAGHNAIVQELLSQHRQQVEADLPESLHVAVINAHFALLDTLLEQGVPVNAPRFQTGNTPLMSAMSMSIYEDKWKHAMLKRLLERGADPNQKNQNQETALQVATRKNSLASVKILVESGKLESPGLQLMQALALAKKRSFNIDFQIVNYLEQALKKLREIEPTGDH